MNRRFSLLAVTIISAIAIPAMAFASGSGGYRSDLPVQQRRDPQAEVFDLGRRVVARKITCPTCAAPGRVKNKDEAAALLGRVQAGEFTLQQDEQQAVVHYLRTRYRLAAVQTR